VSAKDLGTGKSQQVTITGGSALDEADIDQMVEDAESYASQDAERKEAAEARNAADHAVHSIGKQLADNGDKLTEDEKTPVQENLDAVKALVDDEKASAEDLKNATNTLLESAQIIGEKLYEAAQAEAAAAETDGESDVPADDEVVEAEVVEEDE
jgi:molecular chaperone DnaK